MKKRMTGWVLIVTSMLVFIYGCAATRETMTRENKKEVVHEPITVEAPYRNLSAFMDLVKEKYPEIQLEVIPYSGGNTSAFVQNQLKADDMPDIYFTSVYRPGLEDVSDRLIDMSGYDFTGKYAESRLADVSDHGAVYLLPTHYTCIGITYNKTLLEKHGWKLPESFRELKALAPKVKAAGCQLALDQVQYPGYGFQYMCNILSTSFFNTMEGRRWQTRFLNGDATVAGTPELQKAFDLLDEWRKIGMLNGDGDPRDDNKTRDQMAEGNTLFMLGSKNTFEEGTTDEFGMMPFLSEDGSQNAFILNVNRYVGLNKHLQEPGNEQKMKDAVHVMEVLSTVEGLTALNKAFSDNSMLPLKDYTLPETSYYKDIEEELNSGITAPFIYAGWENMIVPVGENMISYMKGNGSIEDIEKQLDEDQKLLKDNTEAAYTTVSEKLDTKDCARLVGIAFAKAAKADASLVSMNKWYKLDDDMDLNTDGVSGALFALPVTDQELTSIIPTGWNGNIQTVTLTGKRIRELAESGYDRMGDQIHTFPYVLVTPQGVTLKDKSMYTVAICGVTDEVAREGKLKDTGILGLDAAREYVSQSDRLSKKDLVWEP